MNYHPYFRGKQYELICIRENAALIAKSGFCPIIEPVRNDAGSILRCLAEVEKAGGRAYVIANPSCGYLNAGLPQDFRDSLSKLIDASGGLSWMLRTQGVEDHTLEIPTGNVALLHDRSADANAIKQAAINAGADFTPNVFVDSKDSGTLYRRHFKESERVLIRDGFRKKKNSEYVDPEIEHYSDLHLTYEEAGMNGFGDFLTVGEEYAEGGGPAYAVAIHLTFVDDDSDSSMFIRHFVSHSNTNPADPAGKFSEALSKLAAAVREPNSKISRTRAVKEFLDLHDRAHYPGLGYVKKLSMQHHIELMGEIANG